MGTANVKQPRGRFIASDPLRGIACIGVLLFHTAMAASQIVPPHLPSAGLTDQLGAAGPPIQSGVLGFWFFFILSGYLLSAPFVRAAVLDGPAPRIASYVRNRGLRLIPAFWLALTVTILVVGTRGDSLRQIVAFYGFAHVYDMGPFTPRMVQAWTLDVEVVFYILLPLLLMPAALLLRGRFTPKLRAALIVVACLVVAVFSIRMGVRGPTGARCVPGSAWAFALGMAVATLELFVKPSLSGARGRIVAYALGALAIGAYAVHSLMLASAESPVLLNVVSGVVCGAALTAPLVYQWATGHCWRFLDNRPLQWFGERAYGLFLYHVLVLYELRHLTKSLDSVPLAILIVAPLVFVIATALGALSYRYIEQPLLRRRASWQPAPLQPALQQP